ncbi:MAG: hypothetical protein EAZ08_06960 [Cytophagales bacterium]|nr:MAG: hypothetical protein EAZ08_06960 [Cytophagales bacterium]
MNTRSQIAIDQYLAQQKYMQARAVLKRNWKKEPDNVWLMARISTTYYEEKKYKAAMDWAEKAYLLCPQDPLVIWDYAGALDMLGQTEQAIALYHRILAMSYQQIGLEYTGEGIRWAKSLLNDCRYRIALAYSDLGKDAIALKFMREHQIHRVKGLPSLYSSKEVKQFIAKYDTF